MSLDNRELSETGERNLLLFRLGDRNPTQIAGDDCRYRSACASRVLIVAAYYDNALWLPGEAVGLFEHQVCWPFWWASCSFLFMCLRKPDDAIR